MTRRVRRPLVLLSIFGLVVAACGGAAAEGSIRYVDPSSQTLIEVPASWHLYELEELSQRLDDLPFVEAVQGLEFPLQSMVAFDGAPFERAENLAVAIPEADYPIGAATVRSIGDVEREFVSRFTLTQAVIPYRSLPNAQEIMKEDFGFGNGYEGVRVLVAFGDETGQEVGVAYLISVTDPEDTRMFSVAAGCSRDCFVERQDEIESVVDSWLVNTRG